MRMVLISLAVLIMLLGIWIWFHFTSVEPTTKYYYEELVQLSLLINSDQWLKAEADLRFYNDKWNNTRNLWIYFINQGNIDSIDSSMKKLEIFIKNKDKAMAQAELEHIRILFNIIKENECLSLENIFWLFDYIRESTDIFYYTINRITWIKVFWRIESGTNTCRSSC